MNQLTIFWLTALLFAPVAALRAAELKLAAVFSDHMVLQRDKPVPVWGWANPREQVTVTFGGQTKTVTADANGKWRVSLDSMRAAAAGGELVVRSSIANRHSKITDVVVGEVWLCSGQSNMHFRMKTVENATMEIAAADHPSLRFFMLDHQFDQKPCANVVGAWKSVSPATAADCSAVAYYFGKDLMQKLGVPVGLVVSSVGGTRIESWMRSETLVATGESGALIEKWAKVSPAEFQNIATTYREFQRQRDEVHPQAVKAAKARCAPEPPEPKMPKQRCHDCPSALHNGMIAPLEPFAIRGAIWYQGESNSSQPASYEKLLPAMIADWRRVGGPELPFLFAQLAPYRNTHPAFREAQHRIWQKTPHTAMVVTTDVGNPENIHPTRKQPVGARLALAARALSYGERVEYSGPVFKNLKVEGNRAVISFTHLGEGLVAQGDSLKGFTMADASGKLIPAHALIEGSTVVVTSEKITKPVAVRYGWAMVPDGNLFNREGLPAAPFRTDTPADLILAGESK
jgi:sialate O-acetylesterase